MPYRFLSAGWIEAVRTLHGGAPVAAVAPPPVRMNLTVTGMPHGGGDVLAHMHSTGGPLGLGHLEQADVDVTLDHATARAMIVDRDPQVAMAAFMAGRIKLGGDLSGATAVPRRPADPGLTRRIQEITA